MMHPRLRRIGPAEILAFVVSALSMFGIVVTARATWTVVHGGERSFEGTFSYPDWSTVHFVPALVFALILPFQLWSGSRRSRPRLHRLTGRAAAVAGSLFSVTGLLFPYVMPARPFGEKAFMTAVSCLFVWLLGRGVIAARRRDFAAHRRSMVRVAALSMSPLTQRVIFPAFAAAGIDSLPRFWDLFLSAAWFALATNIVVAEWWIRRDTTPPRSPRRETRGIAVAQPMG